MLQQQIEDLIKPSIEALGYELWGCEYFAQGKHSLLRVYIDKPIGINIDDCEVVSHQVSAVLDVSDPITGQYSLEVSSPGIPRPLLHIEHYRKYIGHVVELKLTRLILGSKRCSGELLAVDQDGIILKLNNNIEQVFMWSIIVKAYLSNVY